MNDGCYHCTKSTVIYCKPSSCIWTKHYWTAWTPFWLSAAARIMKSWLPHTSSTYVYERALNHILKPQVSFGLRRFVKFVLDIQQVRPISKGRFDSHLWKPSPKIAPYCGVEPWPAIVLNDMLFKCEWYPITVQSLLWSIALFLHQQWNSMNVQALPSNIMKSWLLHTSQLRAKGAIADQRCSIENQLTGRYCQFVQN